MGNQEQAQEAVKGLNGALLDGRELRVNVAEERPGRRPATARPRQSLVVSTPHQLRRRARIARPDVRRRRQRSRMFAVANKIRQSVVSDCSVATHSALALVR